MEEDEAAFSLHMLLAEEEKEAHDWAAWDTSNVADDVFLVQADHQAGDSITNAAWNARRKWKSKYVKSPRSKRSPPFSTQRDCELAKGNIGSFNRWLIDCKHGRAPPEIDEDGYALPYDRLGNLIVKQNHPNCMAIARTCTRLRDVAMQVYYRENKFVFSKLEAMKRFARDLRRLGRSGAVIRNIRLALSRQTLKGDEESKFFSPVSSSMDSRSPFAYMFPNIQNLEVDFCIVRNAWQFGGQGTVDFIDALRHYVRVPHLHIRFTPYGANPFFLLEDEMKGLDVWDGELAELITLENLFGPKPTDEFYDMMLRGN